MADPVGRKPYTVAEGHRQVRSFVLRQGRFSPAQQRAFDESWPRFGLDFAAPTAGPRDLAAVFGRDAPKVLEIGFGTGLNLPHLPPTVTRLLADPDFADQGVKLLAELDTPAL